MEPVTMPSHTYEICLQETLEPRWTEWFAGLMLRPTAGGGTTLCGPLPDKAALHGLLNRVYDLNLTILSVRRLTAAEAHQFEEQR
jgi:hypothetical protein